MSNNEKLTHTRSEKQAIADFLTEKTCKWEDSGAISLKYWKKKKLCTYNSLPEKICFKNEAW